MAKILIVDDAAFMRMMLKDILTKGGFEARQQLVWKPLQSTMSLSQIW